LNARDKVRRELEKSLTSLVSSISPAELDKRNRDVFAEFIENFEYGLALEWLHSLIAERGIQLSSTQHEEIERLVHRMKIDLS
jgi:hypothetical protein